MIDLSKRLRVDNPRGPVKGNAWEPPKTAMPRVNYPGKVSGSTPGRGTGEQIHFLEVCIACPLPVVVLYCTNPYISLGRKARADYTGKVPGSGVSSVPVPVPVLGVAFRIIPVPVLGVQGRQLITVVLARRGLPRHRRDMMTPEPVRRPRSLLMLLGLNGCCLSRKSSSSFLTWRTCFMIFTSGLPKQKTPENLYLTRFRSV